MQKVLARVIEYTSVSKKEKLIISIICMTIVLLVFAQAASAKDIWDWLDEALDDLYKRFVSVSTIVACVAAGACLILMNFSTDDRTVATSRAWLKRILVSWVILNVLGFIMNYLVDWTVGGTEIPSVKP